MSTVIALVTYLDRPAIDADDEPLRFALLAREVGVEAHAWDDPTVDWASLSLCVIRSTWNYHHLLMTKDAMVQPFVPSVRTSGERSLMVINGVLTHTILRRPKLLGGEAGDWDVLITPEDDEVALAHAVLRLVSPAPLYARVDIVRDGEGQVCLMELELVEPSLFLAQAPAGAQRFADAIIARVSVGEPT